MHDNLHGYGGMAGELGNLTSKANMRFTLDLPLQIPIYSTTVPRREYMSHICHIPNFDPTLSSGL